jgi:two-component sensor histidine kinase
MKRSPIADYYVKGVLGSTFVVVFSLWLAFLILQVREGKENARMVSELLTTERKEELKNHVRRTIDFMTFMRDFHRNGMDTETLQKIIIDRLRRVSFGENGYIFIIRTDGLLLLTGSRFELIGTNMLDSPDPEAVKVITESRKAVCGPEGGFIEYRWEKPGSDLRRERKISFVMGFPDWDWIIGAGAYWDDLESLQKKQEEKIQARVFRTVVLFLFVLLTLGGILFIFVERYSRRIRKDTALFNYFLRTVHEGPGTASPGEFRFTEFQFLAERLHESLRELDKSKTALVRNLREKETLLREIHHRVKNNLQIIISLIRLGGEKQRNRAVIGIFRESEYRVRSLALVHELLYESDDFTAIRMDEYVRRLCSYLHDSYRITAQGISIKLDLAPVVFPINTAIPCGLLINELVTNTMKHAFPARYDGTDKWIRVALSWTNSEICLEVEDNGAGFPPERPPARTGSIGLELIDALTKQLKGNSRLDASGGTRWAIHFPR